jgi:hypothetical protein
LIFNKSTSAAMSLSPPTGFGVTCDRAGGYFRYPRTSIASVPSLSSFVLVFLGKGVGFKAGPTPQPAKSSIKRGQMQVVHQVLGAGLVMASVLTPEAH